MKPKQLPQHQAFVVELAVLPNHPGEPAYRLRALLKRALRDWSLRCVTARPMDASKACAGGSRRGDRAQGNVKTADK
ncbi:MAG: hypothetical protein ACO1QB_04890 [Verrucomicrobiales bacterium]